MPGQARRVKQESSCYSTGNRPAGYFRLDCDKTKRISKSEAYKITKRIMKGKPVTALQKMD